MWNEDFTLLENRSADPGDPEFAGFIDAKFEDGRIFTNIYQTPLGRMVSDQGELPWKGRFVAWRESENVDE